jgi:hypothetical protein
MFKVLHEETDILYDSSCAYIPSALHGEEGAQQLWPFTMDYGYDGVNQKVKGHYPGLWELPINQLIKTNTTCDPFCKTELAMYPYPGMSREVVQEGLQFNLERNLKGSRAPLGTYY